MTDPSGPGEIRSAVPSELVVSSKDDDAERAEFAELLAIVQAAKERAFQAVNREVIATYWQVGEHISQRVAAGRWGDAVVDRFADFVQRSFVGIRGYSPQNLRRMRQFFEAYRGNERLSALAWDISWTNNVLILSGAQTAEAREFYLVLAAQYGYSSRELERQIDSMLFERTMISNETHKEIIKHRPELAALRDSYVLEFLDLPADHQEHDLRRAIVANLRDFILEFGKDFAFVGEEYRLQVGDQDHFVDLLFFNRQLACLVAIELKLGRFRPEYLGQLSFYLEALNRDVRKPNENPSVGLILCSAKNDTVVEYALSSMLSPAMVAQYQLGLPDKAVLARKLRKLRDRAEREEADG